MYDLKKRTMTLNIETPIVRFETWWLTPMGLATRLEDAIKVCDEMEFDIILNVRAVSVCIAANGHYEVMT